jgi:hypothetical protein
MNISLLTKWWWKYKDTNFTSKWKTLLTFIYSTEHSTVYSPFWAAVMKLEKIGYLSVTFLPGTQSTVRFWSDICHNNCTLASLYPQLYSICWDKQVLLTEIINSQGECVTFRRTLVGIDLKDWASILQLISSFSFTHSHDKIFWRWESSGTFSVRSLYKILNFRGIIPPNSRLWWDIPIPHKIQIFMWLTCQSKILTKDQLREKGWIGSASCPFCNADETVNHLFITCSLVRQVWFWMGKKCPIFLLLAYYGRHNLFCSTTE